MNYNTRPVRLLLFSFLLLITLQGYSAGNPKLLRTAEKKLADWKNPFPEWQHIGKPKIDSVRLDGTSKKLSLYFSPELLYYPFREDSYEAFRASVTGTLGKKFSKTDIEVYTGGYSLGQLVPNYFRKDLPVDKSRLPATAKTGHQLVESPVTYELTNGLQDNSIALWHSHGYYYEMSLDRWEFQRAKLFGTVEDVSVMGFVVPYLAPMLENAGANVFIPRERDIQTNEVIVDNDRSTGKSQVVLQLSKAEKINYGFLALDTIISGENPFLKGTSLRFKNDSAVFIPDIPEKGQYAVYVSYPSFRDNSRSAFFFVNHTGGRTGFRVDQTIGGGTWIYLGTFDFNQGTDPSSGTVVVKGPANEFAAIDAVRFGGGMGNVARRPSAELIKNQQSAVQSQASSGDNNSQSNINFTWKTSGKPRYLEGSRYYLQYAGMPDSLVYSPTFYKNDYNDDYQSRGLWVNYLMSDPYKKTPGQVYSGLGIPVDISFGFHTDAGITPGDSIIGTLAIYSTGADNGKFPDATSRLASRDLSDIIQTQVVDDIRKQFNADWTRRGLWDKPYAEARRPNVPAILLELLSHQNLSDLTFGLDPRFRFAVSRAIYKGILKYLAYTENREYTVQPLPPDHLALVYEGGRTVSLSWEPVNDELEPTAVPGGYMVYTRKGDSGFNNGFYTEKTSVTLPLGSYDEIYSFKVRAVNKGGESFDSEILSTGIKENDSSPVLIVNGFDRICGPSWTDGKNMAGVASWNDRGVPNKYDIITIGDQYDFDRNSAWLDDDAPGWGATYADNAGKIVKGNSFDFPYTHGKAILAAGHSFISVSDEYFGSDKLKPSDFKIVDMIFGEERATKEFRDTSKSDFRIYTPEFISKIASLTESGASILISGSYLGTDLNVKGDSVDIRFAADILHFKQRTGHAVRTGGVYPTDYAGQWFRTPVVFNTGLSEKLYQAEATDAIEPSGKGAVTAFRYSESNASAGVSYSGNYRTVILGFPFETITDEQQRKTLMTEILNFFIKK